MFDLSINTTLESKTLAAYTLASCADFPCSGNWGCAIFACFRKGVSELCSLVYPGGLSRDLSEFFNRRTKKTRRRAIAQQGGRLHGRGGYNMPCRESFLHVEPFRSKLGFLAILLAWDGPP
ncbi:hypothetical protein GQ457_05G021850 [Hibiscus cannabinus]